MLEYEEVGLFDEVVVVDWLTLDCLFIIIKANRNAAVVTKKLAPRQIIIRVVCDIWSWGNKLLNFFEILSRSDLIDLTWSSTSKSYTFYFSY